MELEKIIRGNELLELIKKREVLLQSTRTQKADWIDFSFGNGSNRSTVCNDASEVQEIKNLLLEFHEEKLANLRKLFREL